MELLRLVAMFLILMTHANFFSLGRPKAAAFEAEPVWIGLRFAAQSFTYIGVNLFILISGYFAIKPRFRGVAAFLFQVLFFSLAVVGVLACVDAVTSGTAVGWRQVGNACMVLTRYNWFIAAYLLLMLFAPALNAFCQNAPRRHLLLMIVLFLAASTYLGWAKHYSKEFNDGYSFVSLMWLYLAGRYLRLYGGRWVRRSWKTDAVHFLIYVVVNTAIALWRMKNPYRMSLFALNNPIQLYGTICFFLVFIKLQFQSPWVNRVAKGTFGIFLLQMHPLMIPYFRRWIQGMHAQWTHAGFALGAVALVLAFCAAGLLADGLRRWAWERAEVPLCRAYDVVKSRWTGWL